MSDTVPVTVVVPLWQKAAFVADALASIARQTVRPERVVVVDDGSTDGGADVVERLAMPGVALVRQANAGPSAARNRGIALAATPFVAFLDADDAWRDLHLETLWTLAGRFPEAALFANRFIRVPALDAAVADGPVAFRLSDRFLAEAVSGTAWVSTCAAMVRRDAALAVGGFAEGFSRGEDLALWIRLAIEAPVALSDYVGILYREAPGSLTGRPVTEEDGAMRTVSDLLAGRDELSPELRAQLAEFRAMLAMVHAAEWVKAGTRIRATEFLRKARETRVLRARYRSLWLLIHAIWPLRGAVVAARRLAAGRGLAG